MVDPLPYMTYQPFLPEVVSGSIEPRHAVVSQRRHLRTTNVVTAKVTGIDHASKTATITPPVGEPYEFAYDIIVVTAGSVSRTFPIPGVADEAIGLKTIEEAVAIRDRIFANFDRAATLPAGPERERLLTFVVVGGGFAGIEVFAEMRSIATDLVKKYPEIDFEDTHFHLIEAMGRIMPEVSLETSHWVLKNLAERGALVHLDTQLKSAVGGVVELSTGESFESDVIVWTAGVMASPMLKNTDLPIEERGRLRVRADGRVEGDDGIVADAWGAGDVAATPDLTGGGVGGFCVPNAQHAVRQGKLMAKNLTASLRRGDHRLLPQEPRRRRGPRSLPGRVPVRQARHHGLPRLGHAPRLPRPRDPVLRAQGARRHRLGEQSGLGPRHRLARGARDPAHRVRDVRVAPASRRGRRAGRSREEGGGARQEGRRRQGRRAHRGREVPGARGQLQLVARRGDHGREALGLIHPHHRRRPARSSARAVVMPGHRGSAPRP